MWSAPGERTATTAAREDGRSEQLTMARRRRLHVLRGNAHRELALQEAAFPAAVERRAHLRAVAPSACAWHGRSHRRRAPVHGSNVANAKNSVVGRQGVRAIRRGIRDGTREAGASGRTLARAATGRCLTWATASQRRDCARAEWRRSHVVLVLGRRISVDGVSATQTLTRAPIAKLDDVVPGGSYAIRVDSARLVVVGGRDRAVGGGCEARRGRATRGVADAR
jgi:hypothetical protein